MSITIKQGDCLEVLATLPENSIDACVTDPPYGLGTVKDVAGLIMEWLNDRDGHEHVGGSGFMSRQWDRSVPSPRMWRELYRVLKPGAYALVFAGSRTSDLMGLSLRLAGFELVDSIFYCFGAGFPKGADVSKSIDSTLKKQWLDIAKLCDNIGSDSLEATWNYILSHAKSAGKISLLTNEKDCQPTRQDSFVLMNVQQKDKQDPGEKITQKGFVTVKFAEPQSKKSRIETGVSMQKKDSVVKAVTESVTDLPSLWLSAILADLTSKEAFHISKGNSSSAPKIAKINFTGSKSLASIAEKSLENHGATLKLDFSVLKIALAKQLEKTMDSPKEDGAPKIWNGGKTFCDKEDLFALCVGIISDLKRIILSQSKTFQNLDTTQQMDCVSAMNVTITRSIMVRLTLFMVDTLKRKALDRAQGMEREVVGIRTDGNKGGGAKTYDDDAYVWDKPFAVTAPATPDAQLWDGYRSQLKPAHEPILICRKPLEGTIAQNALKWGTAGAFNIEATRVGTDWETDPGKRLNGRKGGFSDSPILGSGPDIKTTLSPSGRYPANLILQHAHDCDESGCGCSCPVKLMGEQSGECKSGEKRPRDEPMKNTVLGKFSKDQVNYFASSTGTAARYFTQINPDPFIYSGKATKKDRTCNGAVTNAHPTVKSRALIKHLIKLIMPPSPDAVVIDPFGGSGTTGVAAKELGRNAILIEREAEYVELINARIEATNEPKDSNTVQLSLDVI